MSSKLFLLLICIVNLNAYQYTTDSIKEVIPIVEEEYFKCVNKDKIPITKCKKLKEKQLKDLYLLDMDENRFQKIKKFNEELEIKSKLPPQKPTESGQVMIDNMNDCLDKATNSSDTKKCMIAMNDPKIFIKKKLDPIPSKNKLHIETEEEKPDLTTLLEYKEKMKSLSNASKAGDIIESTKKIVTNKIVKDQNITVTEGKDVVIEKEAEIKKPKKKVRFKN